MEYSEFAVGNSTLDSTDSPLMLLLDRDDVTSVIGAKINSDAGEFTLMQATIVQKILNYAQIVSLAFITSSGLVANALVFLLFYRRPALRSFSNRFVLNLSLAHLLQCVLIQPITVVAFITHSWMLGAVTCMGMGVLSMTLNIASVLSLLLIALDRNCAVNSPLHYTMTITKKRTGVLITGLWALSVLVAAPPLFGVTAIDFRLKWHSCTIKWFPWDPYSIAYDTVLFVLGFIVPLFMTSFVYSSMFRAARNNSERARKHSLNSTIGEIPLPEGPAKPPTTCTPRKKFRRWSSGSSQSSFFGDEWKAVRTGLLVVITFTLCWFPYFSIMYSEAYFSIDVFIPDCAMFFVSLCSFSACVINPYLYVFRNKASRKQIKKLFRCFASTPSSASEKRWMFKQRSSGHTQSNATNPCILAASLVNNASEKVKAFPMLYQDNEGQWQVFSTSEERSREDLDETVSNFSDDFLEREHIEFGRRKSSGNINVHAIYGNNFTRASLPRNISFNSLSVHSNKLLLFRLRAQQVNRDSTSSDTTENYSMSLDSNNGSELVDKDFPIFPARHVVGRFLFGNAVDETKESRPTSSHMSRINSSLEDISSSDGQKCSNNISFIGSVRRRSFIHSHNKNRKSSETTLTSSTNSETLDSIASTPTLQNKEQRPRLIRQEETSTNPPKIKDSDSA